MSIYLNRLLKHPSKLTNRKFSLSFVLSEFSPLSCHRDVTKLLQACDVNMENIVVKDFYLNSTMIPTGDWVISIKNGDLQIKSKLKDALRKHPFGIINQNVDINNATLATNFAITESSVLLYNIPMAVTTDEIDYMFENFKRASRGMMKITLQNWENLENSTSFLPTATTQSFLMNFETPKEAQKALIQKNGVSVSGNTLRMFWYNMMYLR
jgi:hypothetical protein